MEKQQRLSTSGGSPKKSGFFFLSLKLKGVAYDNVLLTPSEEHCTVEKL